MKARSSIVGTVGNSAENVCSGARPSATRWSRATHAMDDESSPPLSIAPTGLSLRSRSRTAAVKIARNSSAQAASDAGSHFALGVELPVALEARAFAGDHETMGGGQPDDGIVKGDRRVFEDWGEVVGDAGLVEGARHLASANRALIADAQAKRRPGR